MHVKLLRRKATLRHGSKIRSFGGETGWNACKLMIKSILMFGNMHDFNTRDFNTHDFKL
jgi:hypothetical protein